MCPHLRGASYRTMALPSHWQPSTTQQGKFGSVAAVRPPCVCSVLCALICEELPIAQWLRRHIGSLQSRSRVSVVLSLLSNILVCVQSYVPSFARSYLSHTGHAGTLVTFDHVAG